jgi:hypothetical protein
MMVARSIYFISTRFGDLPGARICGLGGFILCVLSIVFVYALTSCNAPGSKIHYRDAGLDRDFSRCWLSDASPRVHKKITHTAKLISAVIPRAMRARKTLPSSNGC